MDKSIKKKVKSFIKEFNFQTVTLENLRSVIQLQGYTIVEYNNIFNDKNVAALLEALQLEQIAERSRGFTYADSKRRLVFLHEDLSYEEKRVVLAHEEGHIYCNHFSSTPIIGRDVVEEHEANEFAHYLLYQSSRQKVSQYITRHKKAMIATLSMVALLIIGCLVYGCVQRERSYYGEFYITSTGNKYHEEECIFVKHKNNVERLTIEQFESGEYEPCNMCLPHGGK